LYTDYRLASFGQTTATGLADLLPDLPHIRWDESSQTRSPASSPANNSPTKASGRRSSPLYAPFTPPSGRGRGAHHRRHRRGKPYTDESELVNRHFDLVTGRTVKGISLLWALYLSHDVSLPVAFHPAHKTERVTDKRTGKERRSGGKAAP
jgi:hypothetical protein